MWNTSSLSFFTDFGVCRVVSHTFYFFSPSLLFLNCCTVFFALIKYTFPEALYQWLKGSDVSCSGSVLEPTGTGCVQHGHSPGFFTQKLPLQPPPLPKPYYINQTHIDNTCRYLFSRSLPVEQSSNWAHESLSFSLYWSLRTQCLTQPSPDSWSTTFKRRPS